MTRKCGKKNKKYETTGETQDYKMNLPLYELASSAILVILIVRLNQEDTPRLSLSSRSGKLPHPNPGNHHSLILPLTMMIY